MGRDRQAAVSSAAARFAAKRSRVIAVALGAIVCALILALGVSVIADRSTGERAAGTQTVQDGNPFAASPGQHNPKAAARSAATDRERGFWRDALDSLLETLHSGLARLRALFDGWRDGVRSVLPLADDEGPRGGDSALDSSGSATGEPPYRRDSAIVGRVLSDTGEALVGIGVIATAEQLYEVPSGADIAVADVQRRAVTDNAGVFRFEQLAAGEYRIQNVPTEEFGMAQIRVRSGADSADLVLSGQRNLVVAGLVTDTRGQPLAGAEVLPQSLGTSGVYTDESGHFQLQLTLERHATRFAIRTELPGYRERLTLLDSAGLGRGQPMSVAIELEPLNALARVRGVVRSAESGEPLAGQFVALEASRRDQQYRATTDAAGEFDLSAVETGDGYRLSVDARGGYAPYVKAGLSVDTRGLKLDVRLEPDPDRQLVGRIVNVEGVPVPNFPLVVRSATPPYQATRMSSDAAGQFIVVNPPRGPLVFESSVDPQVEIAGVEGNGGPVDLVVDTGTSELYGLVVDQQGQPVPARNVVLSWQYEAGAVTASTTRRAAADAQGRFSFGQVGPGVHTVTVFAEGYEIARVEHDPSRQGYQFVVRLQRAKTAG